MTATTNFIRHAEPTLRNNAALAYSQCLPESDYPHSPAPHYGSSYNQYAPVRPQPLPVQTPVAKSSSRQPRACCSSPALRWSAPPHSAA